MSNKECIKCRDWIFYKKDIDCVNIQRRTVAIYVYDKIRKNAYHETFKTEAEARKEFDNIYKQLQEEDVEYIEDTKDIVEEFQPTKYKITLTDFWSNKKLMAIHCNTKEKAKKLLEAFDKLGKKWCDGDSYLDDDCYDMHMQDICYDSDGECSEYSWYKEHDYEIYEFKDVDLNN